MVGCGFGCGYTRRMPLKRDYLYHPNPRLRASRRPVDDEPDEPPPPPPKPKEPTNINRLPLHVLGKILEHFDIVERIFLESVCKRWKEAGTKHAWDHTKAVEIPPPEYVNEVLKISINPRMLFKEVSKRATLYVREMTLQAGNPTHKVFHLLNRFPDLSHLWLENVKLICTTDFNTIADQLPNLKSFGLIACGLHPRFEKGFTQMIGRLQKLEILVVSDYLSMTIQFFQNVPVPANLRMFFFRNTNFFLPSQVHITLLRLRTTCPKTLRILSYREHNMSFNLDSVHILGEIAHFTQLRLLELPIKFQIDQIHAINSLPPTLVGLHLGITPPTFIPDICERLPNLEHLVLSIFEYEGTDVEEPLLRLEKLRSLSLQVLYPKDDDVIPPQPKKEIEERHEQLFRRLADMGRLEYFHTNVRLSMETAMYIIEKSPRLNHFYFRMREAVAIPQKVFDGSRRYIYKWTTGTDIVALLKHIDDVRTKQQAHLPYWAKRKLHLCARPTGVDKRMKREVDTPGLDEWNEEGPAIPDEKTYKCAVFCNKPCPSPVVCDISKRELKYGYFPKKLTNRKMHFGSCANDRHKYQWAFM